MQINLTPKKLPPLTNPKRRNVFDVSTSHFDLNIFLNKCTQAHASTPKPLILMVSCSILNFKGKQFILHFSIAYL